MAGGAFAPKKGLLGREKAPKPAPAWEGEGSRVAAAERGGGREGRGHV